MATNSSTEHVLEDLEHVLGDEYEHKPVPVKARRSTFSVSMVWIGFPMIITGAMTGSILVAGMGFKTAVLSMLIGNLLMFGYVGTLGLLGTSRGFNFALLASAVLIASAQSAEPVTKLARPPVSLT